MNFKNKLLPVVSALMMATTASATTELVKPMQGFPPSPETQVTHLNWTQPGFSQWGFRNVGIMPSLMIPRGSETLTFEHAPVEGLADREFTFNDETYTLLDSLKDEHTDGFIVIKDGKILYEEYFGEFGERDHHLWASCTKSMIGIAAAILAEQGKLDVNKTIQHYLPELKESAFAGLTVQQVLNMVTALDYSEDLVDLVPGSVHLEYFRRVGLVPAFDLWKQSPADPTPRGVQAFLPNFRTQEGATPGEKFEYQSPNVDVIAFIIERQSGMPLNKFLSKNIWSKLQTEHDGVIAADVDFTPVATGGMTSTLRDFARMGKVIINDGKIGNEQIVSKEWIDSLFDLSEQDLLFVERSVYNQPEEATFDTKLNAYKDFWWIHDAEKGIATARGVFGQFLMVNRENNVVIATFSSNPTAQNIVRNSYKRKMHAAQTLSKTL